MEKGLYEKIISLEELNNLKKDNIHSNSIDKSDLDLKVSLAYEKIIREKLISLNKSEKIDFINSINKILDINEFEIKESSDEIKITELLAFSDNEFELKNLVENRPKTSLANSTLFVGGDSEYKMINELRKEIKTADEIYLLVSFIKFHAITTLIEDLREFTRNNSLKIITTTYIGATDAKAIKLLSQLPNTEIKVSYDIDKTRLHAKAYIFKRSTGFSTAYIGSSNMSKPALDTGLEWNVKITEYTSPDIFVQMEKTFKTYWNDNLFSFYIDNEENYNKLRKALKKSDNRNNLRNHTLFELSPLEHQEIILNDLEIERKIHNSYRNLVVAATGTGKTILSAFDYLKFAKGKRPNLLFIAHRKEILEQSIDSFRQVLKDQNFGDLMIEGIMPGQNNHIFASLQTLYSNERYLDFKINHFDYIVMDECHHSTAKTYDKILKYFKPKILLGLTATPERTDDANILEYFNNRIASEIRLPDAINQQLLAPFNYFGISDNVSLEKVAFKKGKYVVKELENLYSIHSKEGLNRIQLIVDKIDQYVSDIDDMKALGFCVSIEHAVEMAKTFNDINIPSLALHSRSSREERDEAKSLLQEGKIKCIFTVDLFNEGVDIPLVNTVLFLRPTESHTIFLQQLGRGLRKHPDKEVLTVLDFIGLANKNYDFTKKFRSIADKSRENIRKSIKDDTFIMPLGSNLILERKAKEYILDRISTGSYNIRKLREYVTTWSHFNTDKLILSNFINYYEIDLPNMYRISSISCFRELLFQNGLFKEYIAENISEIRKCLFRFSMIDSRHLLVFAKNLFNGLINLNELNARDKRMLSMIHYTIWDNKPEISYIDSLDKFIRKNTSIKDELIDIIDIQLDKIKNLGIPFKDKNIPLDIHSKYTQSQIFAALGISNEKNKKEIREGVYYDKETNTDIFFITIHKNEKDYLPSTMYKDYAINERLFNWESQNKTSDSSDTGRRYIEDRSENHKILIFVRDYRTAFGRTAPYVFLGNARYHSHSGNKPIEFEWYLENKIPARIIKESELRAII